MLYDSFAMNNAGELNQSKQTTYTKKIKMKANLICNFELNFATKR